MPSSAASPFVVANFNQFRLEPHVEKAIRNAWSLAVGQPLNASHLLKSVLLVAKQSSGLTSASSEAFRKLVSLISLRSLTDVERTEVPPPDLSALPLIKPLADSFDIALSFLKEGEGVWGRDYITLALLAKDDSSLAHLASEANSSVKAIQDSWFSFVSSTEKHRKVESWQRWWRSAGVPLPTTTTSKAGSEESGDARFDELNKSDFTEYAWDVLNAARHLGDSRPRPSVCTVRRLIASLMLSGFQSENFPTTGRWLNWQMENEKSNNIAEHIAKFYPHPALAERQSFGQLVNFDGTAAQTMTRHLKRTVDRARKLAVESSHGKPGVQISARHLLGAALSRTEQPSSLDRFLPNFGLTVDELRAKMIGDLPNWGVEDDVEVWRRLVDSAAESAEPEKQGLPTQIPIDTPEYTSGPSGFNSEYCAVGHKVEVQDQLRVEDFAKRLAELIALRETRLPLAIGLFGNWGSGKSHFMNLMDQRMQAVVKKTDEKGNPIPRPEVAGPWCWEIVPVYFNAWHYVDTNLWASLVAHIFESLFTYLKPKPDELQKVQDLLEQASGTAARAAEELSIAKEEKSKAQVELSAAKAARETEESFVQGLVQGLKALLPEKGREEVQKKVGIILGVQKELKTLDELERVVADAKTTAGRAQRLWNSFWGTRGWTWRLSWLVVVAGAAYFAPTYLAELGLVKQGRDLLARAVAVIAPLLPLAAIALKKANSALKTVETWTEKARQAQLEAQKTPAVKAAEQNIAAAQAREDTARVRLAEADAKEKQLAEEARNLSPERRICRFIERRAQSSDYRGQLGLVSLARRDFEELSDLFANDEALKRKVEEVKKVVLKKAEEKPGAKSAAPPEAEHLVPSTPANAEVERKKMEQAMAEADKKASELEKLSRSIDRIVLFVDDLDRCQPDKVVDVLQAVHLLLAFPLFAVVVGVDQRCLRQSLQVRFKGLLTQAQQNQKNQKNQNEKHGKARKPSLLEIGGERPATPLDYLEKIFHIPFHLPAMEKTGFESLVEKLTEPHAVVIAPAQPKKAEPQPRASAAAPGEIHIAPIRGENLPDEKPKVVSPPAPEVQKKDEIAGDAKRTETPHVIGSVPLQRWERDALKEYYALIQTPRGATRLLNTYRLVRAGIPKNEWTTFCGNQKTSGEFRIALLLLAASAGCPAVAREWFSTLRKDGPRTLSPDEKPGKQWESFAALANEMVKNLSSSVTEERLNLWLDRVERFTF